MNQLGPARLRNMYMSREYRQNSLKLWPSRLPWPAVQRRGAEIRRFRNSTDQLFVLAESFWWKHGCSGAEASYLRSGADDRGRPPATIPFSG